MIIYHIYLNQVKREERKSAKLPPCAACTALVGSFEKGMERTSRKASHIASGKQYNAII